MWPVYVALVGVAVYLFVKNIQDIESSAKQKQDLVNGKNVSYTIDLKENKNGTLDVVKDSRQRANVKLNPTLKEKIEHRAHTGGGFVSLPENDKGTLRTDRCYADAVKDKWVVLRCVQPNKNIVQS